MSEELALKIEHVSKEYRLGMIGGATLKAELQSKFAKLRHREDPNLKIGEKAHGKNERFLALDDVSFEIKKGERVAIIGHNGAGKSTLLKLICRVTAPTKGNIYINGRITSMLEVGTGFHQELTGRENIYLNGAILGMTKAEVAKKYDEIVEFSEIAQFIDTPVKRYSSGMRVKLGFSVASHLDSEIMIMDEVLAVGDVNFQNKCIAQMKKVAEEEGRTILYVSHNMATVKNLCDRCIVLSHGKIVFDGGVDEGIAVYMEKDSPETTHFDTSGIKRGRKCNMRHLIQSVDILDSPSNSFDHGDVFKFSVKIKNENTDEKVYFKSVLFTADGSPVGVVYGGELDVSSEISEHLFTFDTSYLFPGKYIVDMKLYDQDVIGNVAYYDQCRGMSFGVNHHSGSVDFKHWFPDWGNAVLPCVEKTD